MAGPLIADTGGLLRAIARHPDGRPVWPPFARALATASQVVVPDPVLTEVDYFLRDKRMAREAGCGVIKARLKGFNVPELLNLLHDLYQASPENRQFLQGRLAPTASDLEKYRGRVIDAVYPDPFSQRPVRIGEAERLIRHYRLSTGDVSGTVDLMLALVEAGTEQAVDLGFGDEAYFGSLERVLESVVEALPSLPVSVRRSIVQRLQRVAERSDSIGWGFGDAVRETTAPVTSLEARRALRRRPSR